LHIRTLFVGIGAFAIAVLPSGRVGQIGLAQSPAAGGNGWTSFQGGPAHPGSTEQGPVPALKLAWRSGPSGDARLSGPVFVSGLVLATGVKSVVGIDPSVGTVLWAVDRITGNLVPPAVDQATGPHGVIVYTEGTGASGAAIALDLVSHTRVWRTALSAAPIGAPTISAGHVFLGTGDGFVYSLDAASGSVTWRAKTQGVVVSSPAVGDGKVFAVGETTSSSRVYALDVTTGRVAWSYPPGRAAAPSSSPSVMPGTVFVGFGNQAVALNTGTGSVRWTQAVRGDFSAASAPAISGGSVFAADRQGGLYRFDATTGKRAWDYQFSSFSQLSAPLVVGGVVFEGLDDGTIAAVSTQTGRLRWRTNPDLGPIGPLAPAGDLLLAPALGTKGGMLALQHDPATALIDLPSTSSLRPLIALRNYGAAFVVMLVVILAFFRLLLRRGPGSPSVSVGPSDEGSVAQTPGSDE
jgi:outer membrane protein assembly factor BamB